MRAGARSCAPTASICRRAHRGEEGSEVRSRFARCIQWRRCANARGRAIEVAREVESGGAQPKSLLVEAGRGRDGRSVPVPARRRGGGGADPAHAGRSLQLPPTSTRLVQCCRTGADGAAQPRLRRAAPRRGLRRVPRHADGVIVTGRSQEPGDGGTPYLRCRPEPRVVIASQLRVVGRNRRSVLREARGIGEILPVTCSCRAALRARGDIFGILSRSAREGACVGRSAWSTGLPAFAQRAGWSSREEREAPHRVLLEQHQA